MPEKAAANIRNMPMLPMLLLVQIAKRIGLSKQVVGMAFKRMFSEKMKRRAFAGYEPTQCDVFVTTFGKSGTNWMMQIAQQIAWHGAAEFDHIHDIVPWPDGPGPVGAKLDDLGPQEASPAGLRVIKTHLETRYVPYCKDAKYLTVLRDPKEVLVSSYYFLGGLLGVLSHLSPDDWFEICTAQGALATGWATHAASFWQWRDRPNVLVLNYRDILKEPVASIERVASLMNVALTPPQLEAVVLRSSFAHMKAHESQFAPPRFPFIGGDPVLMVRRGKAGDSEELLDRTQQAEIDRICQAELERLGSNFPYAREFVVFS